MLRKFEKLVSIVPFASFALSEAREIKASCAVLKGMRHKLIDDAFCVPKRSDVTPVPVPQMKEQRRASTIEQSVAALARGLHQDKIEVGRGIRSKTRIDKCPERIDPIIAHRVGRSAQFLAH